MPIFGDRNLADELNQMTFQRVNEIRSDKKKGKPGAVRQFVDKATTPTTRLIESAQASAADFEAGRLPQFQQTAVQPATQQRSAPTAFSTPNIRRDGNTYSQIDDSKTVTLQDVRDAGFTGGTLSVVQGRTPQEQALIDQRVSSINAATEQLRNDRLAREAAAGSKAARDTLAVLGQVPSQQRINADQRNQFIESQGRIQKQLLKNQQRQREAATKRDDDLIASTAKQLGVSKGRVGNFAQSLIPQLRQRIANIEVRENVQLGEPTTEMILSVAENFKRITNRDPWGLDIIANLFSPTENEQLQQAIDQALRTSL